jgi:hypothetical protein
MTKRVLPIEFNNFKVAKLLLSIINSMPPYVLFNELLSDAVIESRKEFCPWFLDMSRTRIGKQSFANRISNISRQISFDWFNLDLTKDAIHRLLKGSFYRAY